MQSKEILDRLDNPPIIDGRKKPIDLGDMEDDMNREMARAAIYDIVEETLKKYDDGNLKSKAFRHEMSKMLFRKIDAFYNFELIDKEPTTADEYNKVYISDINKEIVKENTEERNG